MVNVAVLVVLVVLTMIGGGEFVRVVVLVMVAVVPDGESVVLFLLLLRVVEPFDFYLVSVGLLWHSTILTPVRTFHFHRK